MGSHIAKQATLQRKKKRAISSLDAQSRISDAKIFRKLLSRLHNLQTFQSGSLRVNILPNLTSRVCILLYYTREIHNVNQWNNHKEEGFHNKCWVLVFRKAWLPDSYHAKTNIPWATTLLIMLMWLIQFQITCSVWYSSKLSLWLDNLNLYKVFILKYNNIIKTYMSMYKRP